MLLLPVSSILAFQLNLTSWSFQYLSDLFLKVFTDSALTTVSGRLFQTVITLLEKKIYGDHTSHDLDVLYIFPLVAVVGVTLNFMVSLLSCLSVIILYNSIISPHSLWYFSVGRFNVLMLCYVKCNNLLNFFRLVFNFVSVCVGMLLPSRQIKTYICSLGVWN